MPWPIIRYIRGAANGFAIWPLFDVTKGPGPARTAYLSLAAHLGQHPRAAAYRAGRHRRRAPSSASCPSTPARRAPGRSSENYLWPFFGYTDRTLPYRYSERRYFWPFFVQGRGDDRLVDRWGPFYTHSNIKGTDSTWVVWPLWHQKRWVDDDIAPDEDASSSISSTGRSTRRTCDRPNWRPRLQAASLAPHQHLGQRRRQPAAPGPEPARGLLPRQSRHAGDRGRRSSRSTATTSGRPARPAPPSSGTPSRGGAARGRGPGGVPPRSAPRHAPACRGAALDHLRIRFRPETGQR